MVAINLWEANTTYSNTNRSRQSGVQASIACTLNILRREGVSPQQAKRLDTIDASAQHLLSIINNILDISKIEAGKFVLEEAPVVISSLMANVSSILSERAKAKGTMLGWEIVLEQLASWRLPGTRLTFYRLDDSWIFSPS